MAKKASKETAKPADDATGAPKGRSKIKLAALALIPLLLAGGGYAAWTLFLAPASQAEAATPDHAEGGAEHGAGAAPVAPPLELLAETSFTHSLAIAVMIRNDCGKVYVPQLLEASNAEARENGELANLSWMAAARRIGPLTEKTCGHLLAEVDNANARAARAADEKLAAEKSPKHAAPAHH